MQVIEGPPINEDEEDKVRRPCSWDVSVRFFNKVQAKNLINHLFSWGCPISFSYDEDMSGHPYVYSVTIEGMSWGQNLVELAQFVQNEDSMGISPISPLPGLRTENKKETV